jgi:hypothetical protein
MSLSDVYIALNALLAAMLVGVVAIGFGWTGVRPATVLTGVLFIVFVAVGVGLRTALGWDW